MSSGTVASDIITKIVTEGLGDIFAEHFKKWFEEKIEELAKSKGITLSVIYFTVFKPKIINEHEFIEIVNEIISKIGKIKEDMLDESSRKIVIVGKSQFLLQAFVTKLSDILLYENMYSEFIDAVLGVTEYTKSLTDEELTEELEIEGERLEEIIDATLIIHPLENAKSDDVYILIKTVYDEISQNLSSERIIEKIRVFSKDGKALNAKGKKLSTYGVSVYRGEGKLTAILYLPSQILNKEIYKVVYD